MANTFSLTSREGEILDRRVLFLKYHPKYLLLLCEECQHALEKSSFLVHIKKHLANNIQNPTKQALLEQLEKKALDLQFGDLQSSNQLLLREEELKPLAELPILHHCYTCLFPSCYKTLANKKNLGRHIQKDHSSLTLKERKESLQGPIKAQSLAITGFFFPIKDKTLEVSSKSSIFLLSTLLIYL